MTPAFTLTLSAQTMTAVSAVIVQQMRLADVVIDQTFSAHRALMTPYFASQVKEKAPVAKKKAIAPKLKTKAPKKAKVSKPGPKLVVAANPVAAAPVAKVAAVKAVSAKTPVAAAAPVAPVAKAPAKAAVEKAAKTASKPEPKAAVKLAAKVAAVDPKPAPTAKAAPRGKKVSVPGTPWDGKKASAKKK